MGCAPGGYCAAVDAEGNAFAFSGGSWSGTSGDWGSVSAISCVNPSFCMSVSGGISQWDGGQWTQPDPYGDSSSFVGVSCPTTSFCTAVDASGGALQWNGLDLVGSDTDRARAGTDHHPRGRPHRRVVPSATYCAATDASGGVLQWTGTTWSRADVDPGHPLTSISCPTPSICVAVDHSGRAYVGRD